MPITIHGNQYITVAERLELARNAEEGFNVETEVLAHDPVVVRATITINGHVYTGISAANPNKTIEKQSPYEVAETSAVGRALGFAGFGVLDGLATADEMVKAEHTQAYEEKRHVNKSITMPSRTMEQFDSGKFCKKCNGSDLKVRISNSPKNPGREYYHCNACPGFSHWVSEGAKAFDPELESLAASI